MKLRNYFILGFFVMVFANLIKAQDISFEGNVEEEVFFDGLFYIKIKITDGPLKGKTETLYFRTGMHDSDISVNNTELGGGMPVAMLIEGRSNVLRVKGTIFKTVADFEDPQSGAITKNTVYRIKEIEQIEPKMEMPVENLEIDFMELFNDEYPLGYVGELNKHTIRFIFLGKMNGNVKDCVVSFQVENFDPLSEDVKATISGNEIKFSIKNHAKLSGQYMITILDDGSSKCVWTSAKDQSQKEFELQSFDVSMD